MTRVEVIPVVRYTVVVSNDRGSFVPAGTYEDVKDANALASQLASAMPSGSGIRVEPLHSSLNMTRFESTTGGYLWRSMEFPL